MSEIKAPQQLPAIGPSLEELFAGVPNAAPVDAWAVTWDGGKVKADSFVGQKRYVLNTYETVSSDLDHFGKARLFVCREVFEG